MDAELLYNRFRRAMAKQNCECGSFDELDTLDKTAWEEVATTVTSIELTKALALVVEDFLPNLPHCALQDFGLLNDTLIKARAAGLLSK